MQLPVPVFVIIFDHVHVTQTALVSLKSESHLIDGLRLSFIRGKGRQERSGFADQLLKAKSAALC